MDDPDDFGPWLLHVQERAGRGVITHLKLHLNLRFLRLLLFQDQTCAVHPLFAPLQTHLEQKQTKETKSCNALSTDPKTT